VDVAATSGAIVYQPETPGDTGSVEMAVVGATANASPGAAASSRAQHADSAIAFRAVRSRRFVASLLEIGSTVRYRQSPSDR